MRDLFRLVNDYPVTAIIIGIFILILVKEIASIFRRNNY